jgi:hypothetical protein
MKQMFIYILALISLASETALAQATESLESELRETVTDLAGFGSRVTGYAGANQAADYLKGRLQDLGIEEVYEQHFPQPIPVDEGFELTSDGEVIRLYGVWPNLVRTSTTPPEGISGEIVYGGDGTLAALDGIPIEGRIVAVEYGSGYHWVSAFHLGARAVIFLGSGHVHRKEGMQKFLDVPADLPRFFVKGRDAERVRDLGRDRKSVTVWGQMTWRNVTGRNLIGILPGSDSALEKEAIYLSAYYDAMSPVPAIAPGAEQASSVAALLHAVERLKSRNHRRTVVVVLVSGHFENVAGIRYFVPVLQAADNRTNEFTRLPLSPSDQVLRDILHRYDTRLFLGLDLTTGTEKISVSGKPRFPYRVELKFPPLGPLVLGMIEAYEDSVLGGELRIGHSLKTDYVRAIFGSGSENIPLDASVAALAGAPTLSIGTAADSRAQFDSPWDLPDRLDYGNLAQQTDFVAFLAVELANRVDLPEWGWGNDVFASLKGQVVHFGLRSYLPDHPTGGSLVRVRRRDPTIAGVRPDFWAMADEEGYFSIPGLETTRILYTQKVRIEAYRMDAATGRVTDAPDWAHERHLPQRALKVLMVDPIEEVQVVTTEVEGLTLFETFDPRNLLTPDRLEVIDATMEAEPDDFGATLPLTPVEMRMHSYYNRILSWIQPTVVLFGEPGSRLKAVMSTGEYGLGRRLLLLNGDASDPEGSGYPVSEGRLTHTVNRVAADFAQLNRQRIDNLESHGVFNHRLEVFQKRSEALLSEAEEARAENRHSDFLDRSRLAWSYAAAAYRDVSSTQSGVIQGALFLLAMVVPFAHFAERIVFGFPELRDQVFGFFGFFLAAFLALRYLHPAFELSISPAIILLGFVILVLSILVTSIGVSRLNQEMRDLTSGRRGRERSDLQRRGTWGTSIGVGLAHLRRRPLRTGLTCGTLVLLTFSVLSFTSIRSTLITNRIDIGPGARYDGVMLRMPGWQHLEMTALESMIDRFGADRVAPRAWLGVSNLTQSYTIERSDVEVSDAQCLAIVGLTELESKLIKPQEGLVAGRWLRATDHDDCLLPVDIAESLQIGPNELGKATVRVFGETFRVVGILEPDALEVKDLNNESVLPLDSEAREFAKSRIGTTMGSQLPSFPHHPADQSIVLPFDRVMRWEKATLASIGILAGERFDRDLQLLAETMDLNLFAGIDGNRFLVNTVGVASVSGVSDLAVPIGIAALIVLNTMLGAVYERTSEIGTFNAVGLAPGHVSGLFLAEAAAYAVVGGVMGYLLGQTVAQTVGGTGILAGLELNYSSLSAVISLAIVMCVVMASALYPAREAGRICTPGIERKWQPPKPVNDKLSLDLPFTLVPNDAFGMASFLQEFWASRQEQSIGAGFYIESLDVSREGDELVLTANAWLAPFDQGVMQDVNLTMRPDPETGYYEIQLTIRRTAGDAETWARVNRTFLDDVRKQFLVWRTLSAEDRQFYVDELDSLVSSTRVSA